MAVAKPQAYYDTEIITAVKVYIVQAPDVNLLLIKEIVVYS